MPDRLTESPEPLADVRAFVETFYDDDLCHRDNHGKCHIHGWIGESPCLRDEATRILAIIDEVSRAGTAEPPTTPKDFTERMGALDARAVEAAASVFMSYLPNNNRANTDADRQAARNIVATFFQQLEWDAAMRAVSPEPQEQKND